MRLPNATGQWNWRTLSRWMPMSDIRAHPVLPWIRNELSMNKDITVEAIHHLVKVMTNATGEWDWRSLSRWMPMSDIRAHPDLPWDREGLSMNNEMTVEAMNHLVKVMTNATGEWDWRVLSRVVPIGDIRAHPDLPWDREGLSWNKEMTVEAMNHLVKVMTNATGKWELWSLSSRVPMEDIRLHHDLPWSREGLSMNKDITVALMDELDEVLTSATDEWDWRVLSSKVPIGDIRLHPDLPWDRHDLSMNKDITVALMDELDQVMTNAVGEWNWYDLSYIISMEEIRAHPDLPWNKWMVNTNPGITVDDVVYMDIGDRIDQAVSMEEIKANPLWSWNRGAMSGNTSITVEMVVANLD